MTNTQNKASRQNYNRLCAGMLLSCYTLVCDAIFTWTADTKEQRRLANQWLAFQRDNELGILGRDDARNCAKAWIAEMTEKYNTK